MIEADYNNGSSVLNYGYDVAGNLVDLDGTTRTFNEANQMTNDGTNMLTYDNNGNLRTVGSDTYTWDRANRLLSIGNHSYVYDGLGNRVQQTVSSVVTDYLNDLQPGLTKLLKQTTGANVDRFVHSVRGIHAVDDGSNWNFYANDGLGSVRAMVDDVAMVQSSMSFDPYGMPLGTNPDNFGFTGEQTDENGQVFLRARYYEPTLGIFSALDPFEGIIDAPMSLNGYAWVEGNVINAIDPTGMYFWRRGGGISGQPTESALDPAAYDLGAGYYAHTWIQKWLEDVNGFLNTHIEFPRRGKRVDAFVLERLSSIRSPLEFSEYTFGQNGWVRGHVYEIEPLYKAVEGFREVITKTIWLHLSSYSNLPLRNPAEAAYWRDKVGLPQYGLRGRLRSPDGWIYPRSVPFNARDYDFRLVQWGLANSLTPTWNTKFFGPARVAPSNWGVATPTEYWIMMLAPGLIVYLTDEQIRTAYALSTSFAISSLSDEEIKAVFRRAYELLRGTPEGSILPPPLGNPVPAYSSSNSYTAIADICNSSICVSPRSLRNFVGYTILATTGSAVTIRALSNVASSGARLINGGFSGGFPGSLGSAGGGSDALFQN